MKMGLPKIRYLGSGFGQKLNWDLGLGAPHQRLHIGVPSARGQFD